MGLLQWDCSNGTAMASQRLSREGHSPASRSWKQAANPASLGPGTGSGHRKVLPTSERDKPHPRGKGLPSVPTPDPQAAPGHLRLQVPGSPATQGYLLPVQPNLCPVSPAPTAGRLGGVVREGPPPPGWDSPATMNPEQKREGGVGVPWSDSAHQTVPHLQCSSFQPHPNSCIPSGDLCVCCSREWALTTQARICHTPPTCPGSHPNSPLQPPAQTTEWSSRRAKGQPKPTLRERPPGTTPRPAAICRAAAQGLAWLGPGPLWHQEVWELRLPAPEQGNNTPRTPWLALPGPQELQEAPGRRGDRDPSNQPRFPEA